MRSLENLFVGKPIDDLSVVKVSQEKNIDTYVLESKNKTVISTYSFNPFTFELMEQKLSSTTTKNELTISYDNYKIINGKSFPQKIIFSANGNEETLKILLNLKINRIDQDLSFPFEIPKDYKKTEL